MDFSAQNRMRWVKITTRILVAGGALFAAALAAIAILPRQPRHSTEATVTRIAALPSGPEDYAPLAVVVAKTVDGKTGYMHVPAHKLRCKVGDRIRATREGVSVRLDQSSCADLGRYN